MPDSPISQLVLPDGTSVSPKPPVTERGLERERENADYVPVIVKRSDEAKRHPDDILEHAICEGLEQLNRPLLSLGLSAVAAGLILGFSVMAVAVISRISEPLGSPLASRLAAAFAYPLGFIISIMSGTQLFTEHTATAVYPVLDRKAKPLRLLRLWAVVITGNLLGTFVSAVLITSTDAVIQAGSGYRQIAEHLFAFPTRPLLLSAILAGLLMAQGAWLVMATSAATAQILGIYLVTFLIGVGGLHHSVAGSAEAFVAYLIDPAVSAGELVRFIGTALIGNMIGGGLFVAVLNYAHVRRTQTKERSLVL